MNEIIKVIYGSEPEDFDAGLVVGCDPDVGITIVNADDHEEFLLCANGPAAPLVVYSPRETQSWVEVVYPYLKNKIDSGVLDLLKYNAGIQGSGGNPTAENCPFGQ